LTAVGLVVPGILKMKYSGAQKGGLSVFIAGGLVVFSPGYDAGFWVFWKFFRATQTAKPETWALMGNLHCPACLFYTPYAAHGRLSVERVGGLVLSQ
ncbi:hypothetical protein Q2391_26170, partial [Escherichia coli]|nr:hypothetical protein [Escherichia coli]